MKAAFITIAILGGLIVAGGLLLNAIGDGDSRSLLSAVSEKKEISTELKNYGPAPEFTGIKKWLNLPAGEAGSDPLTINGLQGKVVLIDFWTYSCINCIRTLPYLTGWYEKYKDKGFVIVGMHTPEFAFEKDTSNVETAMKRHNIKYPVAQDNDFATWNAYSNRYWPAHYLVDQEGNVVYYHFGEGKYEETEQAIQQLLGLADEEELAEENMQRNVKTPEVYFGLKRLELLAKDQTPSQTPQQYDFPLTLAANNFALDGQWSFNEDGARLAGNSGRIRLDFYSKDVHMVAASGQDANIKVFVDGQLVDTVKVNDSRLYTLFEGGESKQRILELEITGEGFEAYTFTFG